MCVCVCVCVYIYIYKFTFSHLADAFIQSDLQMRTIEAIKTNQLVLEVQIDTKKTNRYKEDR